MTSGAVTAPLATASWRFRQSTMRRRLARYPRISPVTISTPRSFSRASWSRAATSRSRPSRHVGSPKSSSPVTSMAWGTSRAPSSRAIVIALPGRLRGRLALPGHTRELERLRAARAVDQQGLAVDLQALCLLERRQEAMLLVEDRGRTRHPRAPDVVHLDPVASDPGRAEIAVAAAVARDLARLRERERRVRVADDAAAAQVFEQPLRPDQVGRVHLRRRALARRTALRAARERRHATGDEDQREGPAHVARLRGRHPASIAVNGGERNGRRRRDQNIATTWAPMACASRRLKGGLKKNCASGCTTSQGAIAIW